MIFTATRSPVSAALASPPQFYKMCLKKLNPGGIFVTQSGQAGVKRHDLVWAPVCFLLLREIFGSNTVAAIGALKEVLPFTDVLPVASLAWLLRYGFPDSSWSRALGIVSVDGPPPPPAPPLQRPWNEVGRDEK